MSDAEAVVSAIGCIYQVVYTTIYCSVILPSVCIARLCTRLWVGDAAWRRVEDKWAALQEDRPQPSPTALPNLLAYAAYALLWASAILLIATAFCPTYSQHCLLFSYTSTLHTPPGFISSSIQLRGMRVDVQNLYPNRTLTTCHFMGGETAPSCDHPAFPQDVQTLFTFYNLLSWLGVLLFSVSTTTASCILCSQVKQGRVYPCGEPGSNLFFAFLTVTGCCGPAIPMLILQQVLAVRYSLTEVGPLLYYVCIAVLLTGVAWLLLLASWMCASGTDTPPSSNTQWRAVTPEDTREVQDWSDAEDQGS